MKKLIALSLSAGMMLAAAAPTLAFWHMPSPTTVNSARVMGNDVGSNANSGYNSQSVGVITTGLGSGWFTPSTVSGAANQQVITGTAFSAASSTIGANQADCGCMSFGTRTNMATVIGNDVSSSANTGFNGQKGMVITTGGKGTVVGSAVQGAQTGGAMSEGWQIIGLGQ